MRLAPTAILTPAFNKAKDAEYPIALLAPVTIATLFSNTLTTCQHDKQVIMNIYITKLVHYIISEYRASG
jgi:hypothetical protein